MSLFTFNFCRNTKKVFLPPKITENQRKELIEQLWREARNEMWLVRHKHEVSAIFKTLLYFFRSLQKMHQYARHCHWKLRTKTGKIMITRKLEMKWPFCLMLHTKIDLFI